MMFMLCFRFFYWAIIFFPISLYAGSSNPAILTNPVIFNSNLSAVAGDIVGLQGSGFGDAPKVSLEISGSSSELNLPLINTHGQGWLTFKIPENIVGPLVVHVNNGNFRSAPVKLNAALGYHLDTLEIVPLGCFRIFGRNLLLPGYKPSVTVDGLGANIDLTSSNENMLLVFAPKGISSTSNSIITVDNGNGTGPSI
jgi:hypothetical protein